MYIYMEGDSAKNAGSMLLEGNEDIKLHTY